MENKTWDQKIVGTYPVCWAVIKWVLEFIVFVVKVWASIEILKVIYLLRFI